MTMKIALIGDIHSFWTTFDTEYFNHSDYQYLFFSGDLPHITGSVPNAKKLADLTKPGIMVPGNHDSSTALQFIAELKNYPFLARLTAWKQARRVKKIAQALGHIELGGYSIHPLTKLGADYACLVARPHSMGGDRLYFKPYLKKQFGISTLQESQQRLKQLIDRAPSNLIFLAHNGPSGLGNKPTDPWGCDFDPNLGDFGDQDLRAAIDYAQEQGKKVLAVVAGHMHHHLKGQPCESRNWWLKRNGILYINAARVPRIYKHKGKHWHHHVSLNIGDSVSCQVALVSEQ